MEVDAFLILVLSVYVAHSAGAWVLAIGLARYLLLAAEQVLPWLRRPTPPRYWGKVVAALQGIVLTVAAADVLPTMRHRAAARRSRSPCSPSPSAARSGGCGAAGTARSSDARFTAPLTAGCAVLLALGRAHPAQPGRGPRPGGLRAAAARGRSCSSRSPCCCPRRPATSPRWWSASLMALVMIAKTLDMGFYFALNRSFDPVIDWTYVGSLYGLLRDSLSTPAAIVLLTLAAVVFVALLVLTPARPATAGHRSWPGTGGSRCAARRAGGRLGRDRRVGSRLRAALAAPRDVRRRRAVRLRQRRGVRLRRGEPGSRPSSATSASSPGSAAQDPLRNAPADQLLTRLRGKDVIFAFVESYGRSAVQGSSFAPGIDARARRRARSSCARDGFGSRSAFLTSPDLRRDQLARALHLPVRAVGGQPAAVRRADDQPAAHPEQALRAGGLAHRQRHPGQHPRLAAGCVLRLRPVLRLPQRRLPGAAVRLPDDARPVHPRRVPPARARPEAPPAGDGRDRPRLQPRPVVADAAPDRPGDGR